MSAGRPHHPASDSHGCPDPARPLPLRQFLGNRYVYSVLSQRAGGLSIGINLNPDQRCNFDCIYCEVDRSRRSGKPGVHLPALVEELECMLDRVHRGRQDELGHAGIPAELLALKEVAISGDGEPTLCPNFNEALKAIVGVRARHPVGRFKIVLITNAIGLGIPKVREGILRLAEDDEVWAKLDAGSQSYMDLVNSPGISIELILKSIRDLARLRPVVIQSLFPLIDGQEPPEREIEIYARNLRQLKDEGAWINLVQIYSAHRPAMNAQCGHLPLRSLSKIAQTVREISGLSAEVF